MNLLKSHIFPGESNILGVHLCVCVGMGEGGCVCGEDYSLLFCPFSLPALTFPGKRRVSSCQGVISALICSLHALQLLQTLSHPVQRSSHTKTPRNSPGGGLVADPSTLQ